MSDTEEESPWAEYAPLNDADQEAVFGKPIDVGDDWTQDDEDRLLRRWATSRDRASINSMSGRQAEMNHLAWRTFTVLFGRSPLHVLTAWRLAYGQDALGVIVSPPCLNGLAVWAVDFAAVFSRIVCHPVFGPRDHRSTNLRVALRFAIMCRSGDNSQPWHLPRSNCPILMALKAEIGSSVSLGNGETLHERHRRLRDSMPGVTPSLLSNVLLSIGHVVPTPASPVTALMYHHGDAVFHLCRADVRAITRAIETMQPPQISCKAAHAAFRVYFPNWRQLYPSREQLAPAIERAALHGQRSWYRYARRRDVSVEESGDEAHEGSETGAALVTDDHATNAREEERRHGETTWMPRVVEQWDIQLPEIQVPAHTASDAADVDMEGSASPAFGGSSSSEWGLGDNDEGMYVIDQADSSSPNRSQGSPGHRSDRYIPYDSSDLAEDIASSEAEEDEMDIDDSADSSDADMSMGVDGLGSDRASPGSQLCDGHLVSQAATGIDNPPGPHDETWRAARISNLTAMSWIPPNFPPA